MRNCKFLAGIDEAGRGPLAGPVAIGVAIVTHDFDWDLLPGVADSKKLSETKREEIFKLTKRLQKEGVLDYAVVQISAQIIDREGIARVIPKGITRALQRLKFDPKTTHIQLDGSLKAPSEFSQETIIKGDQKEKIIGLASIVAKVTRDRFMAQKSALPIFAPYTFHVHKGYGTKAHRDAIARHGLSPLHRETYCKNIAFK